MNTFRMGQNMPFLQPFTYKEINLGNIYIKTDYSMYKAKTGSKVKLTGALYLEKNYTVDVNSPKKTRDDLADKLILTEPGYWPLTEKSPVASLYVCFYKFKMYFERETLNNRIL